MKKRREREVGKWGKWGSEGSQRKVNMGKWVGRRESDSGNGLEFSGRLKKKIENGCIGK